MGICQTPYTKRHDTTGEHLAFPCGKCYDCIKSKISTWSYRLNKQTQISESAYFVTITYNTDSVPITKNGFMTLKQSDLQYFLKRLRKLNKSKISYYAVGEYGENKNRPHYHIIIYNADINTLEKAWFLHKKSLGELHVGQVNELTTGYTLKYMYKPKKIPMHKNDDRTKEFSLMSKKLGANYLTPSMIQWHKSDINERVYITHSGGQKIKLPRYYKDKIYTQKERMDMVKHFKTLENVDKNNLTEQENLDIATAKQNKLSRNQRINSTL